MTTIKTAILTALMLYGLTQTMHYGAIWDGRAHPKPNVAIASTKTDFAMEGELIPLWNGQFRLTNSTRSIDFEPGQFTMSFKIRDDQPLELQDHWRSFLPSIVLLTLMGTIGIFLPKRKVPDQKSPMTGDAK